ncbi:hypothetical protein OG21DRAFT_1513049 [Imleria badia]|nr:hypothetical protein OG21DRAFT_1513049 [Imleria badia]
MSCICTTSFNIPVLLTAPGSAKVGGLNPATGKVSVRYERALISISSFSIAIFHLVYQTLPHIPC